MQWQPLELWRAASLAQETKEVEALFDRALDSGDEALVSALKASIEQRIDELESFYIDNSDDAKAVLFEKQRVKLRKLLHEKEAEVAEAPRQHHMAAAASHAAAAPGAAEPSQREISDETRITLDEMARWLLQHGHEEMPGLTEARLRRVYEALSEKSRDGFVSLEELRRWYGQFGKDWLARQAARKEPVLATSMAAQLRTPIKTRRGRSGSKSSTGSGRTPKPLYAWELGGTSKGARAATAAKLAASPSRKDGGTAHAALAAPATPMTSVVIDLSGRI
jgi:hypothetical protein